MPISKDLLKKQFQAFFTVLIAIFTAEMFIMQILSWVEIENKYLEMFLDAAALTLISAPFIYFILINKLLIKNKQLIIDLERQIESLNISALVSETDSRGIITSVNEQFCKVSGYSKDELIGRSHNIVNSGFHPKEFWKEAWETIKAGMVWRRDVCNRGKDGSLYWVDSTIFPKKNHLNKVVGYTSVRINITEREQIKESLKQAVRDAEDLAKSKSMFLANMSHEIRTPMNGVLGMTQLLSETNLTHEQASMVKVIRSCGDGLLLIINDILDLTKIDSGNFQLELKPFNVQKMLEEVVFLFSNLASEKNIDLKYQIEQLSEDNYNGDVLRIKQILFNFISNAIKFTDPGGSVIINVFDTNSENSRKRILNLSVKDTGIGIKKEDQDKLFQAFTQADVSITRKYGGTGLGLAICAKLINLMGGEVKLESDFGVGTTLSFHIPLEATQLSSSPAQVLATSDKNEQVNLNLKVLLVEDNLINQKIAKLMLKNLGCDCDIAGNGLKALEILEEKGLIYSIILMDMQMPEMDGVTATKKILQKYGDKTPRILAMTANVLEEDRNACLEAGMSDFISKPIKNDELKKIILKNLKS